ncbi:MAG: ParA family protein [Clostridia bacterium]|nr:ParA family protein [Clostridia bacterium]
MTHTVVIAFANQKGGVGKTTSAVNVAASVAQLGKKTLLIDADPQGNASSGVGISRKNLKKSLYGVLNGDYAAADAIIETEYKNLSVLPTTIDLAGAEFDLITRDRHFAAMRDAIDPLRGVYDVIIIDCPPSLGLLTVNALSAADGIVIPMQCEYYSLEGLSQLMMTVRRVKNQFNPSLSILGILITMYDGRLNLSAQVLQELKKYYSDKLFRTMIPRNVKLSEAPSFGAPVYYHDKYSRGSLAYVDVAKELLGRIF